MPLPAVGDLAPDFTLLTDEGQPLTLSSLRGTPVVLFFYPKDNTPHCTDEACEFRDTLPGFAKSNAVILGLSPDSVRKHINFKKKYKLTYTLLADTDKVVCKLYGVWGEKKLWGHRYMGVIRTTVIIDKYGVVTKLFEKVNVVGHVAAVMEAVATLASR
ncbi:MAG: peroxiredoxin [Gemmatimonadaceae bacterium]